MFIFLNDKNEIKIIKSDDYELKNMFSELIHKHIGNKYNLENFSELCEENVEEKKTRFLAYLKDNNLFAMFQYSLIKNQHDLYMMNCYHSYDVLQNHILQLEKMKKAKEKTADTLVNPEIVLKEIEEIKKEILETRTRLKKTMVDGKIKTKNFVKQKFERLLQFRSYAEKNIDILSKNSDKKFKQLDNQINILKENLGELYEEIENIHKQGIEKVTYKSQIIF